MDRVQLQNKLSCIRVCNTCTHNMFRALHVSLDCPDIPRYHLRDIVVGKIYFLLVRIKIKHMEIAIIKKETSGTREQ